MITFKLIPKEITTVYTYLNGEYINTRKEYTFYSQAVYTEYELNQLSLAY